MDCEIRTSRVYNEELERGIENLTKGDRLRESLAEAVRRSAVAQVSLQNLMSIMQILMHSSIVHVTSYMVYV